LITYHYGRQSRPLATKMIERGQSYLHAVNITEAELLRLNQEHTATMDFPLAFIFPAEGTFWTEQPLCILDGDWVSDEQQEAARIYRDFLLAPEQQVLAVDYGLRPVSPDIPLHAPFTLENGTDPNVTPETVPALPSPSAEVSDAIKDVFHQVKKKATIAVVLDTSGSMRGAKIQSAREATSDFVLRLAKDDRITVFPFHEAIFELTPRGQAGEVKEELAQAVGNLFAQGGTALYDAICHAVIDLDAQKAEDEANSERRLYGVVVLSDGDDTSSTLTENDMFNCLPSGEDVEGIKVFTIAYGEDADKDTLLQIANGTNGRMFEGDPETLEDVYLAISAEQ
jgi:Ca-activated chloride channel homolog